SKDNLVYHVLNLYDMCPLDMKSEILRYVINKGQQGVNTLEGSMYWTQTRRPHAWADAFHRAFPESVLCTYSQMEYQNMVQLGRKPIRAGHELYRMLSAQGIPTAEYVLQEKNDVQREMFLPDSQLRDNFNKAFKLIAEKLPEVHILNISFIQLPPSESNVLFIASSRARGEYQFSQTLLKSGVRAIGMALFDALAQTKSISGKCNMDYEMEMLNMAWECIMNDTPISGNP
ncbi:MAG: hypothetical protein K9M57_10115, partial [Phycisphaerae bacterium]|nr:hypothetical protein [Phycisphaerae bacterium]